MKALDLPPVRVCAGGCGRMTRPSRIPEKFYPGTVVRANGTHCHTCHRAEKAAAAPAKEKERTMALEKVLETYLSERRARLARGDQRRHSIRMVRW